MAELLAEVHLMRTDMNNRFDEVNHRLESLEKQQEKTNLTLGELRLSNMRIAEKITEMVKYEPRILRFEDAVFRKAS